MNKRSTTTHNSTLTISTFRLATFLITAFLCGFSLCSTLYLLWWGYCSDSILSTSSLKPHSHHEHHGNDDPIDVMSAARKFSSEGTIAMNSTTTTTAFTSTAYSCHPSSPGSTIRSCCQSSIQNPPDKIDIVIPYQYRNASDQSLKYELRSFEKSGLLDHVNTVYLIVAEDTSSGANESNAKLIEMRYSKYITKMITANNDKDASNIHISPQLRIIPMDDIRVPFKTKKYEENAKLGKSHYSPFIPGLAEYYLLVPDDIVMLRTYSRNIWFNADKSLPYAHGFGSWRGGNTRGFPNIAELHGVNFINRCAMQYVIEKYNVDDPEKLSPTAVSLGMMNREKLLAGFYSYNSAKFKEVGPHKTRFFMECHTNGGCKSSRNFDQIFVNIQGNGISIEYKKADKMKHEWESWFEKTFPLPSRFE